MALELRKMKSVLIFSLILASCLAADNSADSTDSLDSTYSTESKDSNDHHNPFVPLGSPYGGPGYGDGGYGNHGLHYGGFGYGYGLSPYRGYPAHGPYAHYGYGGYGQGTVERTVDTGIAILLTGLVGGYIGYRPYSGQRRYLGYRINGYWI